MTNSTFRWISADTAESLSWRMFAVCSQLRNPDIMFPDSDPRGIAAARAVCAGCPVVDECLASAMAEEGERHKDQRHGVRAGLTGEERANFRRQQKYPGDRTTPVVPRILHTKESIFEAHTEQVGDHLLWTGPRQASVQGVSYSPQRLAFILDRTRKPEGVVRTVCGRPNCVLPAHVADTAERQACGTRNGYGRHRRERTPPCEPCRAANTEADRRLRETGSTLALA